MENQDLHIKTEDDNKEVDNDKEASNDKKEEPTSVKKEVEIEEVLSEEVKIQRHNDALSLKDQGNQKFKEADFEDAVKLYNEAFEICPKSFIKTMAILFSNRAACYVKMDEKDLAITDCTSALENNAYYTKARLRRAQMYEATDKLDDALNDYNEILKYDKTCSAAGEAVMRLPDQINERNEKLKTEMLGKLKDLGNICLKPFGLSTNNFKVNQDPVSGGYSINFQK